MKVINNGAIVYDSRDSEVERLLRAIEGNETHELIEMISEAGFDPHNPVDCVHFLHTVQGKVARRKGNPCQFGRGDELCGSNFNRTLRRAVPA